MKSITDRIPLHRKGLIYISITAFLWSSSGLFIKILHLDAYRISFYRSLIAAITIYTISRFRKTGFKIEKDFVSILCSVFYSGILIFFVLATKMTTAANAIFLQFTAPVYLLFLEPLFLKTKFKYRDLVTVLVCLAGMVFFFFGKLDTGNIYGNLLAIAAGVCFALFSLLLKLKKNKGSGDTIGTIITGNLIVSLVCFFIIFGDMSINLNEFFILLYMGAVQIGISYMIFNEGIKYISATETMIFGTLEAIFNPVWVFIGIGEQPSVYALFGAALIILGILYQSAKPKPPLST